ncbi:MAG: glycogen-debranching protein [Actinobacteria bacterium]|nr:glycogen-debranching protein [Actinomycetota bacterium]
MTSHPIAGMPAALDADTWAGANWPLGAHYDAASSSTTFAVAAPSAARVRLDLYSRPTGTEPVSTVDLHRGEDGIWRSRMGGVGAGAHYGYRVWGPGWEVDPAWTPGSTAGFVSDLGPRGERFNPNKLLTDPYAREISHSPASPAVVEAGADGGVFGWGPRDYRGKALREWDTGPYAPKAIVVADATSTGTKPRIEAQDAVVYEAHVRNLTLHPSARQLASHLRAMPGFGAVGDIPERLQGTYAGAALLAPYLKALGVTAIELLPVHESSGSELHTSGASNHWGYMTLGFFAPNRQYAADQSAGGPTREFKAMVADFHEAGIEVYLDVVYNHTGEGGTWGDLDTVGFTSFGGFSTTDYYVLTDEGVLVDGATGCGNQTDLSSPVTQRLVLESLAYWCDEMGVDGFRFDLAPVLGRMPDAAPREAWDHQRRFFTDHPLLLAIRDFANAREIEVIAEAWDLWGYEVGNFPDGWAEWNGRYRDGVRRFLKGDGNTGDFMAMMNGDYQGFRDQGGPQRSINFVTAHDGFCLLDLVGYDGKLNGQPWPFGPSDGGSDSNDSWGSGGNQALVRQRMRNVVVALFLARGVPMLCSGDEFARTQNGNNNPYNLNTIGMWNNWSAVATNAPTQVPVGVDGAAYHDTFGTAGSPAGVNPQLVFTTFLATLRRDHPGLRQRSYGDDELGGDDVSYVYFQPDAADHPANGDRALRLWIDGTAVGAADLLVLINMADEPVRFGVPAGPDTVAWRRIIDTATHFEAGYNCWSLAKSDVIAGDYVAAPWSIVVLSEGPPGPEQPEHSPDGPPASSMITEVADVIVDTVRDWFRRKR